MTVYTDVFGGQNVNPADLSYAALSFSANQTLLWPLAGQTPGTNEALTAQKMDFTPAGGGLTVTLAAADLVSTGQDILVRNLGAVSFTFLDADGGVVLTIAAGEQWFLYVTDNSDAAGTWEATEFGAGSSSATPGPLAGKGLVAITTTLNQSHPYTDVSATPYSVTAADRAQSLVWTGGAGTFNFDSAATLGATWFTFVRNDGSGNLTLDPSGAEPIDGASTLTLAPDESAIILSDGVTGLYTVGRGRAIVTSVTAANVALPGTGTYVLTPIEVAAQVITFTGVLAGNSIVEFGTGAGYWLARNATSGAFSLTARVNGADPGVNLPQGTTILLRSEGTNMRWGDDPLTSTGIVARTAASPAAANPYTPRTITGTASQITVANGDGVSGNPTLSLPSPLIPPGGVTINGGTLTVSGGSSDVDINPASPGTLDNVVIGGITPLAGAFTTGAFSGAVSISGALNFGTTAGTANAQTLTLSPAVTVAAGLHIWVLIGGGLTTTGQATLNVNGSGNVGVYSREGFRLNSGALREGRRYELMYDGSRWLVLNLGNMPMLWEQIAANSSTIDFTSLDGTYDEYELRLVNVRPGTNDVQCYIRISVAGVFKSGAADYQYAGLNCNVAAGGSVTPVASTGAGQVPIAASMGTTDGNGLSGSLVLTGVTNAGAGTVNQLIRSSTAQNDKNGNAELVEMSGFYATGTPVAIDGLRVILSSGNVGSGAFRLYGISKN